MKYRNLFLVQKFSPHHKILWYMIFFFFLMKGTSALRLNHWPGCLTSWPSLSLAWELRKQIEDQRWHLLILETWGIRCGFPGQSMQCYLYRWGCLTAFLSIDWRLLWRWLLFIWLFWSALAMYFEDKRFGIIGEIPPSLYQLFKKTLDGLVWYCAHSKWKWKSNWRLEERRRGRTREERTGERGGEGRGEEGRGGREKWPRCLS